MSHHEAQKIKRKLAPFMSLLLAVACMGLLASCGGGTVSQSQKTGSSLLNGQDSFVTPSNIKEAIDDGTGRKVIKNEILLLRKEIVSDDVASSFITKQGWEILSYSSVTYVYKVRVVSQSLTELKNNIAIATSSDLFDSVTDNQVVSFDATTKEVLNDPLLQSTNWSWNYDAIGLTGAMQLLEGNSNSVSIGIADAPFRNDHADITFEKILSPSGVNVSFGSQCPLAVNYIHSCGANHGMNVSSIIGANQNNSELSAGIVKNRKLIAVESWTFGDQASAIEKLISQKVGVINISQNNRLCPSDSGCVINQEKLDSFNERVKVFGWQVYRALAKYDPNSTTLLVASSGNFGDYGVDLPSISLKRQPTDINGLISSTYSTYVNIDLPTSVKTRLKNQSLIVGGYYLDGGTKKASPGTMLPASGDVSDSFIFAPGGYWSASASNISADKAIGVYSYDGGVEAVTAQVGTSFATPHVTGVVALVLQANPKLSAPQVRDIILTNSDTVDGYRALNAEKSVRAALDTLTKPTVTLTATTTTPQLSQSVSFTASASSPNGSIKTYSWSFGDGTTLTGQTSPTTSHAFGATGDYAVTVTVMDEKGAQNTSTAVHIQPVSPIPNPTVTGITAPSTLTAGVNATFSINGTNLPTTENLVITPSGVGCTGFGYGTRSATAHAFACTPSLAGTLSFTISTAGGVSLRVLTLTVSDGSPSQYSQVTLNGVTYSKEECVKDNITGLVWEGKTASGLRSTHSYTNYDSSAIGNMQRWNGQGTAIYDATANDLSSSTNSIGYVNYVNQINLCGMGSGWRVPTIDELRGLVDTSVISGPKINQNWFPNSGPYPYYWSSSQNSENSSYTVYSWAIDFNTGATNAYYSRNNNLYIRLVRSGQ